ncbi:MAG: LLM class flavin-dependent oxidoreductase [Acidimicrobiia bacterium]|nr:LLM class flavin-dependent oxidoreductase [Acidimicrobiia bacterium]MDH4362980.1 LLM class flavin-dependent oxidoreductase [Acidimicrobiia bacterium]
MPVEMIGWIAPQVSSEIIRPQGPVFDPAVIAETARIHEEADFDRVLIGYFSNAPDGFLIGAHAAAHTSRLAFLLAHRPGFVAPTVAARKMATLDQLTGGRLAVHLIAGGNDDDQARDGDFADHAARYRRTSEYVEVMRRTWTERSAFDHDGEFYRVRGQRSAIRCLQEPHIPVYGGGGSEEAIAALGPHVDIFMLWGEPLAETAAFMERVRAAAVPVGRRPEFSVSTRPILGATTAEAWERAHDIVDRINSAHDRRPPPDPTNRGSQRLLALAGRAEVFDTCLYTTPAAASGAPGNSTALVGTPDEVAEALVAYYDLGVRTLLIRGYDPLPDAVAYGEELIPRVRRLVAHRDN